MNKRAIWAISILMSTALIGIIFIQLNWIKWSVNLNEKNFNDKVYFALNEVQKYVQEQGKEPFEAYSFFRKKNQGLDSDNLKIADKDLAPLLNQYDEWTKQRLLFEIKSMELGFDPTQLLESINPKDLDKFIKQAFKYQGIDLKFDYGIYSNASKDFFIVNGIYTADIGITPNASYTGTNRSLMNSNATYTVPLFSTEFETPGSLRVFFPRKIGWLWSSVMPSLISSIIFTALILFCFLYTIYVIFRQKKISEMKNDFINNMTHEFKTPIATISLASDSINAERVKNDPEKVMRFANIIKEENNRMLSQVEKVLQMARIDKKEFELNISTFDLHSIITKAVEHANLKALKKDGVVISKLEADPSVIQGDETHISNIVYNLLDNANKYSPVNPHIEVSTKNVNGGVQMVVRDNGIGMTKEAQRHIFDKFYRVHTGNLHDVKGFGLGLSYVKALVTAHGGTVSVDSDLGKGSSFIVFFPFKTND